MRFYYFIFVFVLCSSAEFSTFTHPFQSKLNGIFVQFSRYDVLCQHIRVSPNVRRWFAANVLLNPACRLGEYILVAPSPEVRTVFVKLVVFFCHFAINDEPLPNFDGTNLCEQVLIAVLSLLKSEVAEHGKHLPHYFSLFSMYAGLGIQEKHQLLKVRTNFCHFGTFSNLSPP